MANSLSSLVNDISKGIHKVIFKYRHNYKKCQTSQIRYKYCDSFLEYTNFKDDLIKCECLCCNKNYQQMFGGKLKKRFINRYKFFDHNNSNFILLLQKGVYLCEFMDD